ncbi:unnamed protein product, partial [Prorocentrum cordatum]
EEKIEQANHMFENERANIQRKKTREYIEAMKSESKELVRSFDGGDPWAPGLSSPPAAVPNGLEPPVLMVKAGPGYVPAKPPPPSLASARNAAKASAPMKPITALGMQQVLADMHVAIESQREQGDRMKTVLHLVGSRPLSLTDEDLPK